MFLTMSQGKVRERSGKSQGKVREKSGNLDSRVGYEPCKRK